MRNEMNEFARLLNNKEQGVTPHFLWEKIFNRNIHYTLSGRTQGSFVKKVWNWLLIVVQRLLGESIGKASMKEAMFSKQRSIAPPVGKFFLVFKP